MVIRQKTDLPEDTAFVKVVVDIAKDILAMGGELHIDGADELVAAGSNFADLWGANVYPKEQRLDYVSMINIRPQVGNRSMEIQDPDIRGKVEQIIQKLLL